MPFLSTFSTISVRGFRGVGKSIPVVTHIDSGESATDDTNYSFTPKNIGSGTRRVFVMIRGIAGTAGRSVSSATVDGVSGAIVSDGSNTAAVTGVTGSSYAITECWSFSLTGSNGSTGTIAITWNGGVSQCIIDVWEVKNLDSNTALAIATSTSTGSGTKSINVNTVDGGFVLASAYGGNNNPTYTWSGATERTDRITETRGCSAADASGLSAETPRSVSATTAQGPTFASYMAVSMR